MASVELALIAIQFILASALYNDNREVIELTSSNFNTRVLDSSEIWVVEFYAPWCGHCQSLAPEYIKLAGAARGLFKVGAVDMTQHQSVGEPYGIQGFPTIKIFGASKHKPTDYQGARTAQAIAEAAINEIRKAVNSKLGGGDRSGSSGGGGGGSGAQEVIELTDSNFDELVLNSKFMWMVEFFAPWCGHCKNLQPHWAKAASEMAGKVKFGALDATVHTATASRFNIKGYPTIKYFAPQSSPDDAVDYPGGRTSTDIVQWVSGKLMENVKPPEVIEAVSQEVVDDACKNKQICVVSVLPDILDCQSSCRNNYLKILRELADRFKKNAWGWIWTEGGRQESLEEAFGMGDFGYPALAAVNSRKMKFSMLKGSFSAAGIEEFLRDLSYGRGESLPIKSSDFPMIETLKPWDGKDGVMPVEVDSDEEIPQSKDAKSEL